MIELLKQFFSVFLERYYHVNLFPLQETFSFSPYPYFYLILFLGIIFLFGLRVVIKVTIQKELGNGVFLIFVLSFWLIFSLPWLYVQVNWMARDWRELYGQEQTTKRNNLMFRLIGEGVLEKDWFNFYTFLDFCKENVELGSRAYFVPADNTFRALSKYYLYPEVRLVYSLEEADYIFSFNVELPEKISGFVSFKEFEKEKLILKSVAD